MFHITGTPQEIIDIIANDCPEINNFILEANIKIHKYKGSMQPYQAACLYFLAGDYNFGNILEVGTGVGYSTFFLANACPNANIYTVNPNRDEVKIASKALSGFENINYHLVTSREYYEFCMRYGSNLPDKYDFIFIDGDHKDIEFDLKWYDRLNENGCILFHDYSDTNSRSSCPPVFNALNEFKSIVGEFDILIVDDVNNYGMAGWYK